MQKRLFIAIHLPESVKEEFARVHQLPFPGKINWSADENLHLTVAFLGEVEEERIDAVNAGLADIAAEADPFELVYEGLSYAPPHFDTPRMIWAGFAATPRYTDLAAKTRRQLADFSEKLREDKKEPLPHVTIGRIKSIEGTLPELPSLAHMHIAVESIHLMESRLSENGSTYTTLNSFSL